MYLPYNERLYWVYEYILSFEKVHEQVSLEGAGHLEEVGPLKPKWFFVTDI